MAKDLAKMRAALNDEASVSVTGAPPEFNVAQPLVDYASTSYKEPTSSVSVPSGYSKPNFCTS